MPALFLIGDVAAPEPLARIARLHIGRDVAAWLDKPVRCASRYEPMA